jgi:hypothetical protein
MLWVPKKGKLRVEHNVGTVGTSTLGTSVTTGGTEATKGTPAEMIASTAFDAYWVRILASRYGTAPVTSAGSMDILIGASTEEVLIADLLMGFCGGAPVGGKTWDFPLYIPAGSRLAVQAAGERTATAFQCAVWLYGGDGYPPWRPGGKVTTYGMGTVPNGTTLTPGATGAEDDAYVEITASTTSDHFAFVPSFQSSADTTTQDRGYAVDIGIGSATEQLIGEYYFQSSVNEFYAGPLNSMPIFQDVPSGTRLAMRASSSGGTLDANYNGVIHAVS